MAATNSIKCDECGYECLHDSRYPKLFTLEVKAINTNSRTCGTFYALDQSHTFETPHHFCDEGCLVDFLTK